MSISDNEMLSYVVERDVDLAFVQLVKTAPGFRRWFIDRLEEEFEVEEYLGVRHSMERDSGESDVEIGVETAAGDSHIVLVENKIDASLRERQAERYFERGEDYVENDGWDEFAVVLIAPSNYVGNSERESFGNVVLYEELIDRIEATDHDGRDFFKTLFDRATAKRAARIDSYWTDEVKRRFELKRDELPSVDVYQKSNKHLRVESVHPDHPHHVLYNVFFPSDFDGEKAVIRLNLTGRNSGSISEEDFESIRPLLLNRLGRLDQFGSRDRRMDPVKMALWRRDFPTDEAYITTVLDALVELIEVYHPAFVQQRTTRTTGTIEREDGRTETFDVHAVAETGERYGGNDGNPVRTGYWILYGLDQAQTELIPEEFIWLSVPDLYTGAEMGGRQIVLVPKESELKVKYD